jgi:phasin
MTTNPQFEVPVDLREFAQKSVDQARKAFEGFVSVAQKSADAVDSAGSNMRANAKSVSSKTLGYAEQNVNAAFDLAYKLVQSKTPQEAFALQSEFLKSQLASLQAQAKEIGTIMQSAATPKSE